MTRRQWAPWMVLAVAVLVVELGWRAPAPPGEAVREPGSLIPALSALRSAPFTAIEDAGAAAIVSGVVFGRTEQIAPAQEATFLESGLWHLLSSLL